jgi:hypothetical protein
VERHFCKKIYVQERIPLRRFFPGRHFGQTFGSATVNAGQGLPMIGKLLRHTQVRATARYVHLAVDHLFVTSGLHSADKRALTDWHYKAIAAFKDIDNEPI